MRRGAIALTAGFVLLGLLLTGCASGRSSHDDLECVESLLASSQQAASEAVEAMRAAADELPADRSAQRRVAEELRRSADGNPVAPHGTVDEG